MRKTSITAIFIVVFCSCSGETDTSDPPVIAKKKTICISAGIESNVMDTSFDKSNEIGVYAVNYEGGLPAILKTTGNHVDNMKYTYTDPEWTSGAPVNWEDDNTKADFYGFYPYAPVSNVNAYSFRLNADQSTLSQYKSSCFLWGKNAGVSPTASAVPILLKHLFSNLIIKIEAGDGFTIDELNNADVEVSIGSIITSTVIDLATGTISVSGNPGRVKALPEEGLYNAWIIPQTVSADDFITVTINEEEFFLQKEFTFIANKQHSFTVTVSKSSSGGMSVIIGMWDTDEIDHGGVAI